MNRYARSMAVMAQKDWQITFDLDKQRITAFPSSSPVKADFEESDESVSEQNKGYREEVIELNEITISEFEFEWTSDTQTKGTHVVTYGADGRCKPYSVKIVNKNGSGVEIKIDALASAETK